MNRTREYWQGKRVLITGGSSGIGRALARQAAALGAHVWLIARREALLAEALQEVRAAAPDPAQPCGYVSADLSQPEEARRAVDEVIRAGGVPDVLINSAGAAHPGYVQELEAEIFRWMIAANYYTTVFTTQAVLPAMIARGQGHIINISSAAGFLGVFGYSAYGPSKFAVGGFSEVLRAELKPHGIRVSIVYPADTDTPQLAYENQFKPPETHAINGAAAARSPEQVAEAILVQAARKRYAIFPTLDVRLFYWLSRWLPQGVVFALLDGLAARGRR